MAHQTITEDMLVHLRIQGLIHHAIQEHNMRVRGANQSLSDMSDANQLVTITQARDIAAEAEQFMFDRVKGQNVAALDAAWNAYIGMKVSEGESDFARLMLTSYPNGDPHGRYVASEVARTLDMPADLRQVQRVGRNSIEINTTGRGAIPIYPYDQIVTDLSGVSHLGTQMGVITCTDIADLETTDAQGNTYGWVVESNGESYIHMPQLWRDIVNHKVPQAYNMSLCMWDDGDRDVEPGWRPLTEYDPETKSRDKVVTFGDSDVDLGVGLGRLRRFMSEDEFRDAAIALGSSKNFEDVREAMHREAANAEAVFTYLQEQGVDFNIKVNQRAHTVDITFDSDKKSLRLLDSNNPHYACNRIYQQDTGYTSYAHGLPGTGAQNTGFGNRQAFVVTSEMAVDLIKYSRGETITRYADGRAQGVVIKSDEHVGAVTNTTNSADRYSVASARRRMPLRQIIKGDPTPSLSVAVGPFDAMGITPVANADTEDARIFELAKNRETHSADPNKPIVEHPEYVPWQMVIRTSMNTGNNVRNFYERDGSPNAVLAESYLREAVESARAHYADEINLEGLVEWAQNRPEDEMLPPNFEYSANNDIARLQETYIAVLTGRANAIDRPSLVSDLGNEALGDTDMQNLPADTMVLAEGEDPAEFLRQHQAQQLDHVIGTYDLRPVPYPNGETRMVRFNPTQVAEFMVDGTRVMNQYGNGDNVIAAMRALSMPPAELAGADEANAQTVRKLVKFSDETAMDMAQMAAERAEAGNPFMQRMYDTINTSLIDGGMDPSRLSIRIDDRGVVRYEGYILGSANLESGAPEWRKAAGEIGQIFEPDADGLVTTKFVEVEGSDSNYSFVPGYTATVLRQKPGETKTMEQRTKLTGYEQTMTAAIRNQLAKDLRQTAATPTYREYYALGKAYSLNTAYSHLYDQRFPVNALESAREQGMSEEVFRACVRQLANRVRYPSNFADDATVMAEYSANSRFAYAFDPENDLEDNDAFKLVGCKNIAILTHDCRGYFDETATVMTSSAQGSVRYLPRGASVGADGMIVPYTGDDPDMYKCDLLALDIMKYAQFDPADRVGMTLSNLLQAHSVVKARVAQGFLYGLNFDDGMVVSKAFAEANAIIPDHGDGKTKRPLIKGDKLSDVHGNKGVLAAVIDPDWTDEECIAHGVPTQARDVFAANPLLDVVQAPYAPISRHNGGQARELTESEKYNFVDVDGKMLENGIATGTFIITNKDADAKTSVYDDDEVAQGKGRKISAQLAWVFDAKDTQLVKREVYGLNDSVTQRLREYLLLCGMDMSSEGVLMLQTDENIEEMGSDFAKREVISIPELTPDNIKAGLYKVTVKNGLVPNMGKQANRLESAFASILEHKGGFIEIPFSLEMTSGVNTMDARAVDGKHRNGASSLTNEVGNISFTTPANAPGGRIETRRYRLPLLSPNLRSGQEYVDGVQHTHEYTKYYSSIMTEAAAYMADQEAYGYFRKYCIAVDAAVANGSDMPDPRKYGMNATFMAHIANVAGVGGDSHTVKEFQVEAKDAEGKTVKSPDVDKIAATIAGMSEESRQKYIDYLFDDMNKHQASAQRSYDAMAGEIKDRYLDGGKHNIFRDNVLAHRMKDSATAIWTANPLLDIDEVAIGREMAERINIKDGDDVMLWRDPVLRTSGVRVMRVRIVDDQTGIAINPAMDKCFDGDFDGDTIGVVSMSNFSPAAQAELRDGFSVATTILDKGHLHDPDGKTPCKDRPRGDYDLNIQNSLDIARYIKATPGADERLEAIRVRANQLIPEFEKAREAFGESHSRAAKDALRAAREALDAEVVKPLSDFTHDAFQASSGGMVQFGDLAQYAKTLYESSVASGAKGNDKKFNEAMQFTGVNCAAVTDPETGVTVLSFKSPIDDSELSEADQLKAVTDAPFKGDDNIRYENDLQAKSAGCTKTSGTPLAGSFSIRLMSVLREMKPTPEAALELTYPVTQGTLQVKHDAAKAIAVFDMLSDSLRNHWRGMVPELDKNNQPIKGKWRAATPEEWAAQFETLYGPDGLDVEYNPEAVEQVSHAMREMAAAVDPDYAANKDKEMPNLEEIPEVGTNIDRMAYSPQGKAHEQLIEMAKNKENLYSGERMSNVASKSVRSANWEHDKRIELTAERNDLVEVRDRAKSDMTKMQYQDRIDEIDAKIDDIDSKPASIAKGSTMGRSTYIKGGRMAHNVELTDSQVEQAKAQAEARAKAAEESRKAAEEAARLAEKARADAQAAYEAAKAAREAERAARAAERAAASSAAKPSVAAQPAAPKPQAAAPAASKSVAQPAAPKLQTGTVAVDFSKPAVEKAAQKVAAVAYQLNKESEQQGAHESADEPKVRPIEKLATARPQTWTVDEIRFVEETLGDRSKSEFTPDEQRCSHKIKTARVCKRMYNADGSKKTVPSSGGKQHDDASSRQSVSISAMDSQLGNSGDMGDE